MNPSNHCTICQTEITQKYCPNCGQEIGKKDATLTSLISDFFSNLLSLEKSVFAGMIKIITNPKVLVLNYSRGNRKYYPSPGKLLVYALAIAALHLTYVNTDLLGLNLEFEEGGAQFIFWLIFFPFLTITSYLSFFKSKFNLAKHIISIGYIASCFFIIVSVVNALLMYFSWGLGVNAFFVFLILIFIWNGRVFISKQSLFKIILAFFLQLIVFVLLVGIVLGIVSLVSPGTIRFS